MKRGEDSGHIKITLRGDHKEEQITIMRKINTSNKSEWVLNGGISDTYLKFWISPLYVNFICSTFIYMYV